MSFSTRCILVSPKQEMFLAILTPPLGAFLFHSIFITDSNPVAFKSLNGDTRGFFKSMNLSLCGGHYSLVTSLCAPHLSVAPLVTQQLTAVRHG